MSDPSILKLSRRLLAVVLVATALFSGSLRLGLDAAGPVRVTKVIDGDTVELEGGERLRLIGIDTPESYRKERDSFIYEPMPLSKEASDLTLELVEQSDSCRIEPGKESRDRYRRRLGYLFCRSGAGKELFVNLQLLEKGLAVLSVIPPNIKYKDDLWQAQERARNSGAGIWALNKVQAAEADRYIGQIRTVRGRVISAWRGKNIVILNFDKDFKTDFSIVIREQAMRFFEEAGLDPITAYNGKQIEITGRLTEYNGPQIIAGIPEQIRVIAD
jgi:micrococcal nuclease